MANAKKPRTPAQIAHSKKLGELAKERAAKAKTNTPTQNATTPTPDQPIQGATVNIPLDQWEKVMKMLDKFEQPATERDIQQATPPPATNTAAPVGQLNALGRPVGYTEKYSIDPAVYPNPIPRLIQYFDDDRTLRRHGLDENYLLKWQVQGQVYETKWGTSVREPFFTVELFQRLFDDQGEETGKSMKVQKLIFTEDEMEAQTLMTEIGIDLTTADSKTIMDEVRFERVKRWLVGIFKAAPIETETNEDIETVIDGKAVVIVANSKILQ